VCGRILQAKLESQAVSSRRDDNARAMDQKRSATAKPREGGESGRAFKKGGVWACANGITTEGTQNKGNAVRVVDSMAS
jgi:hypothetical protein